VPGGAANALQSAERRLVSKWSVVLVLVLSSVVRQLQADVGFAGGTHKQKHKEKENIEAYKGGKK
jgi:hypothetical protein